jgi:hypothetical protein
MKTLSDYIVEAEQWIDNPQPGDDFAINIREITLIESYVTDVTDDGIVIAADQNMLDLLEGHGYWLDEDQGAGQVAAKAAAEAPVNTMGDIDEAEYHGRHVELNKPTKGDVKKSKVYVKDPKTGNVKKVNFGDPNMRIKKSSPAHRKSFRARHHCENPGPKTKARYWSCRAW